MFWTIEKLIFIIATQTTFHSFSALLFIRKNFIRRKLKMSWQLALYYLKISVVVKLLQHAHRESLISIWKNIHALLSTQIFLWLCCKLWFLPKHRIVKYFRAWLKSWTRECRTSLIFFFCWNSVALCCGSCDVRTQRGKYI